MKGWKENRPKNRAMQDTEFLGQSFTYMVMTNITVLATTKVGTSHGAQLLTCFTSRDTTGLGVAPAAAGTSTGCTAFAPRCELTRTWISEAEEEERGGRGSGSSRVDAIGDVMRANGARMAREGNKGVCAKEEKEKGMGTLGGRGVGQPYKRIGC